ncbi:MAG: hypothetical protein KDC36_06095 [Thermoleophilia bacterium]|nr:hypothetical protein [Thermoleophilia bacterium]
MASPPSFLEPSGGGRRTPSRLAEAIGLAQGHPQLLLRSGHWPAVAHSPRVPVEDVVVHG